MAGEMWWIFDASLLSMTYQDKHHGPLEAPEREIRATQDIGSGVERHLLLWLFASLATRPFGSRHLVPRYTQHLLTKRSWHESLQAWFGYRRLRCSRTCGQEVAMSVGDSAWTFWSNNLICVNCLHYRVGNGYIFGINTTSIRIS